LKKIIILGSSGRLGSYISKSLEKIYQIYPLGKIKKVYTVNLLNKKSLELKIIRINPDVIINCVAATNVDECIKNYSYAYKGNTLVSSNIVDCIKRVKKKIHLIHFSTDHVYSGQLLRKSKENQPNSVNNYSRTKLLAEKEIKKIANHTIIRFNFFGKLLKGNSSFSDFIVKNLKNRNKVKIPLNVIFNPIHVFFLVKYLKIIIQENLKGTFNVGSRNSISKYDFAFKLAKLKKLNEKLIIGYQSNYSLNKRPLNTSMNCEKFEKKVKKKMLSIDQMFKLI
jgi:dTDP-4-dehydrorhamnose reductase